MSAGNPGRKLYVYAVFFVLALKTLSSLNKEVLGRFSKVVVAFRVFPLLLPLAITAFGGPEGYFRLAIIAFGAFQFIAPKHFVS